jgi:toxin HigB-1
VIVSWRHKGLKLLYVDGDGSKIRPDLTDKVQRILSVLDVAEEPGDVDLPGFHLHALRGDLKGFWSVTVSRNHRIIFRFNARHVSDVNLVDYH